MRTIKFRGKRINRNGEWAYGDLRILPDRTLILPQGSYDAAIDRDAVDEKTIGQFTGLLDKDGKEIYEGDIVNITDGDDILVGHGVVEWLDNWGLWYVDGEGHANNGLFDINCSDYLEVIGNIHDNPELLKGE